MAFCTNCGSEMAPDARFCPTCGTSIGGTVAAPQPIAAPQPVAAPKKVLDPDAADNRFLCILAYFGLFMLIPLVAQPNSAYCRYHCNQGIILILLAIACTVIAIIPFIGWFCAAVGYIFTFVCMVFGIINTCCGKMKGVPLIGKLTILH